jgi:hypothetical protein
MFGLAHQALDLGGVRGLAAQRPVERNVARRLREQLRRAGSDGGAQIGDRGQLLVLDLHQLGRVLRLRARLGDHQCHRLAGMQHALAGQRRAMRHLEGHPVKAGLPRRSGDAAGADDVSGCQHGEDAGGGRGGAGVDAADAGKRVRRAHEPGRRLPGLLGIGGEAALAAQQRGILDAWRP